MSTISRIRTSAMPAACEEICDSISPSSPDWLVCVLYRDRPSMSMEYMVEEPV